MANEEKKAEAEQAAESPDEAAGKSKKRKLLFIIIGGVVLTAGIGGGLAFFMMSGGSDAKMAAKSGEDGHGEEAPAEAAGKPSEQKAEGEGDAKKKEEQGDKKAGAEGSTEKKAEKDEKKAEAPAGEGKGKEKDSKLASLEGVDFGCTQTLTPFHLNLGNPLENRYVRLEIALEFACAEEIKAEIEKRLPQLRDAVITVTSRKTREFLLGPDGKEQLRKEIHNRINHYMTRKIDDVYITDILIE